jgi:peptidylprolyl isomerase
MPLRIPRLRFRIWGLIVLVAFAALAIFALMPSRPGFVDIKMGTGPAVAAGDTLSVHYVGRVGGARLSDWLGLGKVFDSSRTPNVPFTFPVGAGQVIRGWDLGMVGMKAGGVRRLVIGPADGYGASGIPGVIPRNSTLIFEVELLKILPKPAAPITAPPPTSGAPDAPKPDREIPPG